MKYGVAVKYVSEGGKKQPSLFFDGEAHNRVLATFEGIDPVRVDRSSGGHRRTVAVCQPSPSSRYH